MSSYRIAIFASGLGTNAEEICRQFKGHPSIEVVLLLSNDPGSFALERVKAYGVPTRSFTRQQFRESNEVLDWLTKFDVTHIVLAGFIWLVPQHILHMFPNRAINIHPALLPKFGGKGMYGRKVHEQVKAAGETETGITIHLVNENYDDGRILFQKSFPVHPSDTLDQIAAKVHVLEYANYPRVIEEWILKSKP